MNLSFAEATLIAVFAFLIGGVLGISIGWSQSCEYATKLYKAHENGELLVPAPTKYLNGVVYGSAWMRNKICDGR